MPPIDAKTRLCALIGNPVEHSLSPAIHNAAFQHLGLNFAYVAFKVEDVEGAMRGILALTGIRGVSVTIPHNIAVIRYLDEIATTARNIGAVNTIVTDRATLTGYNTDASGALAALRKGGAPVDGGHVLILGSGGAARAIAFALCMEAKVAVLTILAIIDQEREALIRDLREKTGVVVTGDQLTPQTLGRAIPNAQVLIHCTPVGMSPNVGETCVPDSLLAPHLTVMEAKVAVLTILAIIDQEREALIRDLREKTGVVVTGDQLTPQTLGRAIPNAQVLIHCTPVGMSPNVGETCVPDSLLAPHLTVMD